MHKLSLFLILATMMLNLVGCSWGGGSGNEAQEAEAATEAVAESLMEETTAPITQDASENMKATTPPLFDEVQVIEQLEAKHTIFKDENLGNYALVTIQNNSPFNLVIGVEATFYDADGNVVGENGLFLDAIESGYPALFDLYCQEDFEEVSYSIKFREEDLYTCVLSNLAAETEILNRKQAQISVTNNGTVPAQYVEADILFFDGQELVYWDWVLLNNENNEIEPGEQVVNQVYSPVEFDNIQVFLGGFYLE